MTDSPSDNNPKNRKYSKKLFTYIGPQANLRGLKYIRIAEFDANGEPWPAGDAWKFDMEQDEIFMISISENHLQPPPIQSIFCKFDLRPSNEEPIVGDEGIGGLIWFGNAESFKRDFK